MRLCVFVGVYKCVIPLEISVRLAVKGIDIDRGASRLK